MRLWLEDAIRGLTNRVKMSDGMVPLSLFPWSSRSRSAASEPNCDGSVPETEVSSISKSRSREARP